MCARSSVIGSEAILLQYGLTTTLLLIKKPKLDACEQYWVFNLTPYMFDLKRIPATKNIGADVLSRYPFAKTVSHRFIME